MSSRHRSVWSTAWAALLVVAAVMLGCGGGGGGGGTTHSVVTTFTPDSAPANGSLAMRTGSSSGATISIKISATEIPTFFGAAFRVVYDATSLRCNGMDTTGSFLLNGVTASDVLFLEDHTTQPGVVFVTATRLNPTTAPPVAVTTTADLLSLSFSATKPVPGSPTGTLTFGDPKQVCDGTLAYPSCTAVPSITWIGGTIVSQ